MSKPDTASGSNNVSQPEPLTILPAAAVDIPAILEIESASFPTSWQESTYLAELENPIAIFLAAKQGPQIVGFSLAWLVADEIHILKIASAPDHRRQGIATALMARTIETGLERNSKIIYLEVRETNLAAQNFYKKLSFQTLGVRKKYYTDTNEDGLVMAAVLGDPLSEE